MSILKMKIPKYYIEQLHRKVFFLPCCCRSKNFIRNPAFMFTPLFQPAFILWRFYKDISFQTLCPYLQ